MLKVEYPIELEESGFWGGGCGRYYGFQVKCYDTSKITPYGYYYPAIGAVVTGTFYNDRWSRTVKCTIPIHQPKGLDANWCYIGTTIPCSVCGDLEDTYISVKLEVRWKQYSWSRTFRNALHISCPKPREPSPYIIKVAAGDCELVGDKICAPFWLSECVSEAFPSVHISLYGSDDGEKYRAIKTKILTLTKSPTTVCFPAPNYRYAGIALTKPGTFIVDRSWVCKKEWEIRL